MKVKNILYRGLYAIIMLVFGLLFFRILFSDTIHEYKTARLFPWLLLGCAVIGVSYVLMKKIEDVIEKYYYPILFGFLIIYGGILLYLGFTLRFIPVHDMDAIYGGAIEWLKEDSFVSYYEYYGYFPNNLGAMAFLHLFFSMASVLGISDFFAVGIVVNCLLIAATVLTVSLTCRKLRDSVSGVLALVFFLISVPFYFMGAAFYTDSLSLLFPALFYYLYLRFKEQEKREKKIQFALLMAVVLTVGMLIKFTVAIVLVAVVIDSLLSYNWRDTVLFASISILFGIIAFAILNGYMYENHLDREECRQLNTPYLHWVMMGMQGTGGYNPEDYDYTRSFSPEERNEGCLARIRERVEEHGFSGMMKLFSDKAVICFGDGTYALSDFLDDSPENDTDLHQYVLYDGEKYDDYRHLGTGFLLVLYLFTVAGAAVCAFRRTLSPDSACLTPRLACLGILCFLILWETSGRYFTNYVPMFIVSAVFAAGCVGEMLKPAVRSDDRSQNEKKPAGKKGNGKQGQGGKPAGKKGNGKQRQGGKQAGKKGNGKQGQGRKQAGKKGKR